MSEWHSQQDLIEILVFLKSIISFILFFAFLFCCLIFAD